ncbi:Fe-S cluster assembly protein SufB [Thermofilum pendens]|uniref:FeS assembly protein SufB n=1 Tax=Thermofilum pendens (strain DSM 2475 / Hrk 5) TaxID=368408 RepID=A1RZH4_THEPD|nr:Fe-S cluster assembly protein SufB [Thermofilum pendens]ABL78604.1 FeS assembly protein SufB [Thermofilum pendens Hrk 5]
MSKTSLLESLSLGEVSLDALRLKPRITLKGRISRSLVEEISRSKGEPEWMLRLRLRSLELFEKLPEPNWLVGVDELDLEELAHYVHPDVERVSRWEDLPEDVRKVYERLGLPEIERRVLSGLAAQLESENVYLAFKKFLEKQGVILMDMSEAVQRYPDLVKKYFMRVFPPSDHKFAALHGALWSGGVFLYVPPNVRIEAPIEAFFFIASELESQMEHTIVVADEGSFVHFIEGCAAPMFKKYSFHNGMVEVYAHKGSHVKFTTAQNWSKNLVNFNNKRALVEEGAVVEWVEGSIGSKVSYVYPSAILRGANARVSITNITLAKGPVWKDGGAKVYHLAPSTSSEVVSKSISADGGTAVYRGLVKVARGARGSTAAVKCDSLILDKKSKALTYPRNEVDEEDSTVVHEATTGRLSEEALFYLKTRGLSESEARRLVVLGYVGDVLGKLPFEYQVVFRRVLELEFEEIGGYA